MRARFVVNHSYADSALTLDKFNSLMGMGPDFEALRKEILTRFNENINA